MRVNTAAPADGWSARPHQGAVTDVEKEQWKVQAPSEFGREVKWIKTRVLLDVAASSR